MTKMVIRTILAGLMATACFAQDASKAEKPESRFFKLDFVLKEVDGGKVLNARSYSMLAATERAPSSIRTGQKIQEGTTEHPNWVDVGVRIDARGLRESQGQLSFSATTEVTGLPQDTTPERPAMLRQYLWSSDVEVPLRKPTVIFSSESTTSKAQMQVEVTATPVM
jgi:hypothetical protein